MRTPSRLSFFHCSTRYQGANGTDGPGRFQYSPGVMPNPIVLTASMNAAWGDWGHGKAGSPSDFSWDGYGTCMPRRLKPATSYLGDFLKSWRRQHFTWVARTVLIGLNRYSLHAIPCFRLGVIAVSSSPSDPVLHKHNDETYKRAALYAGVVDGYSSGAYDYKLCQTQWHSSIPTPFSLLALHYLLLVRRGRWPTAKISRPGPGLAQFATLQCPKPTFNLHHRKPYRSVTPRIARAKSFRAFPHLQTPYPADGLHIRQKW